MAVGKEPETDENDDGVKIRLGKDADVRVERYTFHSSILQQPQAFSLTLSGNAGIAEIVKRYPPGPKGRCALYIGKYRQFTGELDAIDAHGDSHTTSLELRGRDLMARLHDQDIVGERSFNNATYEELFKAALADCGQEDKILEISNTANRKVRSGANVKTFKEPVKVSDIQNAVGNTAPAKFTSVVTAKMGESWLQFLTRHFGKLGLFAWCDANGNFVLSRPNGDQEPAYHFFRKRGQESSVSNVLSFEFTNDTTHRFSHLVIFARNYGRKHGHNHTNGRHDDVEMMALGINRRRVYRDHDITCAEEAAYYARKKIAEINRASWKLKYTISGHSAPLMKEIDKRGIVVPDMIARVDDDDLGIHENLYIESVEYRSPPRTSIVTMMRPQDLIFGENEAIEAKKKAQARAKKEEEEREKASRKPILFVRGDTNQFFSPLTFYKKPATRDE